MLRMAHRILNQSSFVNLNGIPDDRRHRSDRLLTTLKTKLQTMPIIIADNIAQYTADNNDDLRSIRFHTLPPAIPVFSSCFVEWSTPSVIYLGGGSKMEGSKSPISQLGCLVVSESSGSESDKNLIIDSINNFTEEELTEIKSGWTLFSTVFFDTSRRNGLVSILQHGYLLAANKTGRLIRAPATDMFGGPADSGERNLAIITLALTFAFMHCKNVNALDVSEIENPTQQWLRRQRQPELKYQMLQIDPNSTRTLRRGPRNESSESNTPFHICRGSFAHYVDDGVSKGLFGSGLYGTFWRPAHTRGSLENGRTINTYNILAPE